jgi:hypothetical protein
MIPVLYGKSLFKNLANLEEIGRKSVSWSSGVVEDWNNGVLEYWSDGRMEKWKLKSVDNPQIIDTKGIKLWLLTMP